MSVQTRPKRLSVTQIQSRKGGDKLVCLTAYTAAVKLEGGEEMADTVAFLTRRGIPVMGHVGLTPQAVNALGGYRSRGHAQAERDKILRDGVAIAEAGAFSLVIEGVAETLARELTQRVAVPTIGIGGSPECDGQILVIDDMLGLFADFTPK